MKSVNTDPRLLDAIDQILSERTEGIREYDLIISLDERFPALYPKPDLSDKLTLFQHHFYLKHCLYVLQRQYYEGGLWTLDIDSITIIKRPIRQHETALPDQFDSVRDYYLDLANLNKETQVSVENMISDFWNAMSKYQQLPDAHATLGLSGKETEAEKKQQFRKLAQQHHPDKGGDEQEFIRIQQAWQQIKK